MPKFFKAIFYFIVFILSLLAFYLTFDAQKIKYISIQLPAYGVEQSTTAILIKKDDSFSKKTAALYSKMRGIPQENIFYMDLPDTDSVDDKTFSQAYEELKEKLPARIQTMVATWEQPYRVGCMSITSALTFGFDPKWCQTEAGKCSVTAVSPYFNSSSRNPWLDYQIRPTIMLTGVNISQVQKVVANGVKADFSFPLNADAYLVKTSDPYRNSRWPAFNHALVDNVQGLINVKVIDRSSSNQDSYITGKDLLIYQTGLAHVPRIERNDYLPGAMADHLTSFGGQGLGYTGQMKAFRWLEAGATGSYGTVVEPCNFPEKFPNPGILINKYSSGETLIESYWKSVKMPGEGLFVGEPLARPFGVFKVISRGKKLTLFTNRLELTKKYVLLYFDEVEQQYKKLARSSIFFNPKRKLFLLQFERMPSNKYKVVESKLFESS